VVVYMGALIKFSPSCMKTINRIAKRFLTCNDYYYFENFKSDHLFSSYVKMNQTIFHKILIGQSRETGNIWYTKRRKTKHKHYTIFVGHHYTQTYTQKQT